MESFGHNYNSENKKTYIYSRYVVYKYINSQIFSYIGVLKYTMLQVVKYGPCWGDMGSLSHFIISCTFSRGKTYIKLLVIELFYGPTFWIINITHCSYAYIALTIITNIRPLKNFQFP